MKKLLLLFALLALFASCAIGTVEVEPQATKGTIKNESSVLLQNVRWNGTDFGDIKAGTVEEKIVKEDGYGYIHFEINGKHYNTRDVGRCRKLRSNDLFTFTNSTLIEVANDEFRELIYIQ